MKTNLAAVIVENRKFDNFGKVCKDHLQYLPKDTMLIVFTDKSLADVYKKQLQSVGISNFQVYEYKSNYTIPSNFYSLNGFSDFLEKNQQLVPILNYCIFMTSNDLWKFLSPYFRVLTFQMDTVLLRNGIEEFYEWDYIGAPCYSYVNDNTIMNGGLSLRNPRIMEYITRYYGWNSDIEDLVKLGQSSTASFFAEDIFFSLRMIKYRVGKYPPLETSKLFSVESKFNLGSLGYHNPGRYLKEDEILKLKTQYLKKDLEIKK
jgi:hypothetical protein